MRFGHGATRATVPIRDCRPCGCGSPDNPQILQRYRKSSTRPRGSHVRDWLPRVLSAQPRLSAPAPTNGLGGAHMSRMAEQEPAPTVSAVALSAAAVTPRPLRPSALTAITPLRL